MRIATSLNYATDPSEAANQARGLEAAGVDMIWIPEAYGFDAVSLLGFLAATTDTVGLGSGILNTYSRTPAALPRQQLASILCPVAGLLLDSAPRGRRSLRDSMGFRTPCP